MKSTILLWFGVLCVALVIGGIRYSFETDAEKQADAAEMAAKFNSFIAKHDKSGSIAQGMAAIDLMVSFRDACQTSIGSTNGKPLTDEDKKSFCECASLGVYKLYYVKLPRAELIERSMTHDSAHEAIQKEVFAACNASRHAYDEPPGSQP